MNLYYYYNFVILQFVNHLTTHHIFAFCWLETIMFFVIAIWRYIQWINILNKEFALNVAQMH